MWNKDLFYKIDTRYNMLKFDRIPSCFNSHFLHFRFTFFFFQKLKFDIFHKLLTICCFSFVYDMRGKVLDIDKDNYHIPKRTYCSQVSCHRMIRLKVFSYSNSFCWYCFYSTFSLTYKEISVVYGT